MNVVRLNETIFNAMNVSMSCGFCWSFTYSRKDYANLKDDKDQCCVHVYMENFTTRIVRSDDGFIDYHEHNITLKILLDSLFDIQMFNELEPAEAKSKFTEYIEPLLDCFPSSYNSQICNNEMSISNERITAVYNTKDQNKDGLVYNVTIRDGNS